MRCLFFSYTLPSRPSRSRVHVWRQLKKLGAVNLQSVWVVPYSVERVKELRNLRDAIDGWKGEALIIEGKVLNEDQEKRINKAFIESRDEEYREVIEKCEDFFKELEFEIARQNFIFAEVEENEQELEKLKQWLKKVVSRDVVGAPLRKEATEKVKMSEELFQNFALRVYEHVHGKKQERRKTRKDNLSEL
ncbi:MAG: Chromate resistance protein ChrB [Pseudomonadota bacterium]